MLVGEGPALDRPLSSLEIVHIISGLALSREAIRHEQEKIRNVLNYSQSPAAVACFTSSFWCRDEVYCQICKQLVKNRNQRSRLSGWTLLSICLGVFPPTDLFMKVSLQPDEAFSQSLELSKI